MKLKLMSCGMFLLIELGLGCGQTVPQADIQNGEHQVTAAEKSEPASWTYLPRVGERLVSPVWGPTGRWLLARGWGGVGLSILSAKDGVIRFRDPKFRGPLRYVAPGVLCRGGVENGTQVRWSPEDEAWRASKTSCTTGLWDERLGSQLVTGGTYGVYYHAYAGTITLVARNREEILVEDRGAWGLAATGDGRRVAYSLGSLAEPRLLVSDPEGGTRELGAGAQPAWVPGDRYLVFTKPWPGSSTLTRQGYSSDLFVYDFRTSKTTQLTDTQGVAEMEPTVSPDGRWLAYADWNSGALHVTPMPTLSPAKGPKQ